MDDEKNNKTAATTPVASSKGKGSGRTCCIVSVLLFLVLVGGAAAVVFLVVLKPPGMKPLESEDYTVGVDKESGDITLSPKEGVTHEYSLIWLHGLNRHARNEFDRFADQEDGERLTGPSTKILIPQAGKMKLSRAPPPKPPKVEGDDDDDDKDGKGEKGGRDGKRKQGGPGMADKDGKVYSWFDILDGDKPGAEKSEADWQSRYDQDGLIAASDKIL